MTSRILLSATISALFLATPVLAQIDLTLGTDLSLELVPAHPAPNETVRVQARSTLIELSDATIVWSANGRVVAQGVGVSEATVVAASLGSETTIIARVVEGGTEIASAEARIRPVEMELLWESDSYVPPFFRGRALPSAGTNLRLEALPRFARANGVLVPVRDITFTWSRNGYVIEAASGRGKSKAFLESPSLFGTDTISVEARTSDGIFEGSSSATIQSEEPHIVLYQNHPVFGIAYQEALGARTKIPDVEVSFSAVPYFADTERPDDGMLSYEWRVNGGTISNDPERPSSITINASGSSGAAFVELAITHLTNFFLNASGSWDLQLLGENAASAFGPTP